MKKIWLDDAWDDYLYWQTQDKRMVKRINQLLKDIDNNGYDGIGKPEPLKYNLQGLWSRRIDEEHRLVYRINDGRIDIMNYRYPWSLCVCNLKLSVIVQYFGWLWCMGMKLPVLSRKHLPYLLARRICIACWMYAILPVL